MSKLLQMHLPSSGPCSLQVPTAAIIRCITFSLDKCNKCPIEMNSGCSARLFFIFPSRETALWVLGAEQQEVPWAETVFQSSGLTETPAAAVMINCRDKKTKTRKKIVHSWNMTKIQMSPFLFAQESVQCQCPPVFAFYSRFTWNRSETRKRSPAEEKETERL